MHVPNMYEDVLIIYHSAASAITDAICSMDDPESSDGYIRNRLYSAVYDIAEVVLRVNGARVPAAMVERAVSVRMPSVNGSIPSICDKLMDKSSEVSREELAHIAQAMDCWIVQVKHKYPEVFRTHILCTDQHSLVS